MTASCETCAWWLPINSVAGQCRRMPPQATPYNTLSDGCYWPITNRELWCGEYKPQGGAE